MTKRSLIAFVLVFAAACNSDTTATVDVFGTYKLQTVNGQPLPYTTQTQAVFTAGTITLSSDQSFSASYTLTGVPPGTTSTASGFWSYIGTTISFTQPPNLQAATSGTLDGGTMSLTEGQVTWVYVKQ